MGWGTVCGMHEKGMKIRYGYDLQVFHKLVMGGKSLKKKVKIVAEQIRS